MKDWISRSMLASLFFFNAILTAQLDELWIKTIVSFLWCLLGVMQVRRMILAEKKEAK